MGDDVEVVVRTHCESAVIEMDPGQLDQTALNLAVNARDAMPKGGKFPLETSLIQTDEVFMEQHPPIKAGKYVMLAISDTGSGMDPATLPRIFEPFFTTKEVGKGTSAGQLGRRSSTGCWGNHPRHLESALDHPSLVIEITHRCAKSPTFRQGRVEGPPLIRLQLLDKLH